MFFVGGGVEYIYVFIQVYYRLPTVGGIEISSGRLSSSAAGFEIRKGLTGEPFVRPAQLVERCLSRLLQSILLDVFLGFLVRKFSSCFLDEAALEGLPAPNMQCSARRFMADFVS